MECRFQTNKDRCPCTYPGCPRKGLCCECLEHHRAKDQVPACYFSSEKEETYDRSFPNFVKDLRDRGKI